MSAKYQQLASILRSELSAVSRQGGKLPTEAELSHRYYMSRQTVRHALQILEEEGLIQRRQGSGSYVSDLTLHQQTGPIAVITTFQDDYIFPKILHDVQNEFSQADYSTLLFSTENKVSREREILHKLLTIEISGILIEASKSTLPSPNADLFEKLQEKGIPIVFLHGKYPNLPDFPCISDNNFSGGHILTQYLIQKGHTNIAGIFKIDDAQGPQRYNGMVCALIDRGITVSDDFVCWYDSADRVKLLDGNYMDFFGKIAYLMDGKISAVVCYNDEIAHHLIRWLQAQGKNIPEDIAVVSFDDSYFSQIGTVSITSLSHRSVRTGQAAARILLEMLQGKPPRSIMIDWELTERQSS